MKGTTMLDTIKRVARVAGLTVALTAAGIPAATVVAAHPGGCNSGCVQQISAGFMNCYVYHHRGWTGGHSYECFPSW